MEIKSQKIFFPNLDGLRFFAFFAVLLRHSGNTDFQYINSNPTFIFVKKYFYMNGLLGVNFFFVLSGFLITYLLLNEKTVFGKVDIKSFYIRRVLRIWPVYFLTLIIGFLIIPYFKSAAGINEPVNANPWYYIFFLGNFHAVYLNSPNSPVLDRLWSIAVEEQFYLIWPVVIAFVPVKKLPLTFSFLILISAGYRFIHNNESEVVQFHTLAAMSDLVVGSWTAYLIFFKDKFKSYFENIPRWQVLIIYLLTFSVLFGYKVLLRNVPFQMVFQILFGVIFSLVILEQNYSKHSLFKMSNFKWISKWGVWTYGLYCYHALGIYAAILISKKLGFNTTTFEVLVTDTLIALAVSLLISWFSYKYFETPFLRLKNKLQKVKAHQ